MRALLLSMLFLSQVAQADAVRIMTRYECTARFGSVWTAAVVVFAGDATEALNSSVQKLVRESYGSAMVQTDGGLRGPVNRMTCVNLKNATDIGVAILD